MARSAPSRARPNTSSASNDGLGLSLPNGPPEPFPTRAQASTGRLGPARWTSAPASRPGQSAPVDIESSGSASLSTLASRADAKSGVLPWLDRQGEGRADFSASKEATGRSSAKAGERSPG